VSVIQFSFYSVNFIVIFQTVAKTFQIFGVGILSVAKLIYVQLFVQKLNVAALCRLHCDISVDTKMCNITANSRHLFCHIVN